MTHDTSRQLRRHCILSQLEAADPVSLPTETLRHGLGLAGHNPDPAQLLKDLAYLESKALILTRHPDLDQAAKRHHLTANGRDYLESNGLA